MESVDARAPISEWLRAYRAENRMTQVALAHKVDGLSVEVIKKIETGCGPRSRDAPSYEVLRHLDADLLYLIDQLPLRVELASATGAVVPTSLGAVALTPAIHDLVESPDLRVASIRSTAGSFDPFISEVVCRITQAAELTVKLCLFAGLPEFHFRLVWSGSIFRGTILDNWDQIVGVAVLEPSRTCNAIGGQAILAMGDLGHTHHIVALGCSGDEAFACAETVWSEAITDTSDFYGGALPALSLRQLLARQTEVAS